MMYGSKTTREEWYGALANAIVEAWTGMFQAAREAASP